MASIAPIALYSAGYGILKATNLLDKSFLYTNQYAWYLILALAVVYPLNSLCLRVLFKPIEYFINTAMKVDKKSNPFFKGNFAPCQSEYQYEITDIIEGSVPKDLSGYYLRNGPNSKNEHIPANNR